MAVELNRKAYDHAKQLIRDGSVVRDDRHDWSKHQPSADDENTFLDANDFGGYGLWYLGVDREAEADTKGRYKFPFGDFEKVHLCGVLAAESRAAQQSYREIEIAAAHLHGMLDMTG